MIAGLISQKMLQALDKALWVVGGLCLLIVGFLGIQTVLNQKTASQLNASSLGMETQLKHTTEKPTTSTEASSLPHGLETLHVLQKAVTSSAAANHVQLIEFRAGTEVSPYIPRYQHEMPEGEWSQADARFTLVGGVRNVMLSLRGLRDLNLPFEIDTVNLSRNTIQLNGSADLSVDVQLRTISPGAAG